VIDHDHSYDDRSNLPFEDVQGVQRILGEHNYLASRGLATAVLLSLRMRRPLLLEGEAGVGKTQVAKTIARVLGSDLIRLQCYEGIDSAQALYEWDYGRQLLFARALQDGQPNAEERTRQLYGPEFLLSRPLLQAVRAGERAVLLIDEIDRADDEFEAFLLEVLSDFTVTIPEFGTIRAVTPPAVILTSNRTRELHDALKRRCMYHWIDFPDFDRELEIVRQRAPAASERLAHSVVTAVGRLRGLDLVKRPGSAEAIDWANALAMMGADEVTSETGRDTLGWVIKNHDDLRLLNGSLGEVLGG
jgi:MoxR-like ATPase